jgi:hypothetical protein
MSEVLNAGSKIIKNLDPKIMLRPEMMLRYILVMEIVVVFCISTTNLRINFKLFSFLNHIKQEKKHVLGYEGQIFLFLKQFHARVARISNNSNYSFL